MQLSILFIFSHFVLLYKQITNDFFMVNFTQYSLDLISCS